MRSLKLLPIVLLLLPGCIAASLHPLHDASTATVEKSLEGFWDLVDEEHQGTLRFTPDGAGYHLQMEIDDGWGLFEVRTGRLDGELYFDLTTPEPDRERGEHIGLLLQPHIFLYAELPGDEMTVWLVDLHDVIRSGELEVDYLDYRGDYLIGASTLELQAIVAEWARNPDWRAENDAAVFRKRKPGM